MEEQIKALQATIEDKLKNAASKAELETIKSEMKAEIEKITVGVSVDELKAAQNDFNEKLKAQWVEVEARLKSAEPAPRPLSFGEKLKQAFKDAGMIESSVDEFGRTVESVKFDRKDGYARVKAAFDMNTAGTTASVDKGYQTNYGMVKEELPLSTDMHLIDVFPHMPLAPIERHFAKLVEYEETDGTGLKTETTAAGDSSFKIKTVDFKVFDYGVKFRVHRNLLRTWVGLQNRIQTIGMDRLKSKFSTFILGSAGDNSATPYGILNAGYYTAYDTTLRANEVKKANIVDVIANAILQADIAEKSVNAIMLNPVDVAELKSLKDANDNRISQAGLVVDERGNLSYIHGLQIIKTKKITANTAILVNTVESVEIGDKFNMEVLIGYDKTEDFSKGILTIQIESEFAIGIGDPLTIIYISDITTAASNLSIPE
jgi:HK97 family phage major capsid protein